MKNLKTENLDQNNHETKEYLMFSYKEIYSKANGLAYLPGTEFYMSYYKNEKYTSRISEEELEKYLLKYSDAQIIYQGKINNELLEVIPKPAFAVVYEAERILEKYEEAGIYQDSEEDIERLREMEDEEESERWHYEWMCS